MRDSDAAWWLAGVTVGAALLLLWAHVDANEQIREQAVRIQTLEANVLQYRVERSMWVCTHVRKDARSGDLLVKHCIRKDGV